MLTSFIRNAEAVAYLLSCFALGGDEDCDVTDSDGRFGCDQVMVEGE